MMLIRRQMSQLLIVDLQDKVLAPIPNKADIVQQAEKLVRAAGMLDIPITLSEQYPKGLGPTIETLGTILGAQASIFEKIYFSCLRNDPLRNHLDEHRDQGRGQIIVAGIESHVCVAQTALELIADGYQVFAVVDAMGSRAPSSHELALGRLERAGAFLVNTEMALFEWLEKAGTSEFKSIQALIK